MLKKLTLNMTKFASVKKIHRKIILVTRNLKLNDLEFFCYSKKKPAPTCSGLYWLIFHFLYHQNSKFSEFSHFLHRCIFTFFGHTIKPVMLEQGTTKHGTPMELQNTPKQWGNNGTPQNTSKTPRNTIGTTT